MRIKINPITKYPFNGKGFSSLKEVRESLVRCLSITYENEDIDCNILDLNLSDYQSDLLSKYACKLHPKD